MKISPAVYVIVIAFGLVYFFQALDSYIKYKNRKAGKKYCEENGLTFIKARSFELHTRLYFSNDGKEGWANYETDKDGNITWKRESPLEKLQSK